MIQQVPETFGLPLLLYRGSVDVHYVEPITKIFLIEVIGSEYI